MTQPGLNPADQPSINRIPLYEDSEDLNTVLNIPNRKITDIWGADGYIPPCQQLWDARNAAVQLIRPSNSLVTIKGDEVEALGKILQTIKLLEDPNEQISLDSLNEFFLPYNIYKTTSIMQTDSFRWQDLIANGLIVPDAIGESGKITHFRIAKVAEIVDLTPVDSLPFKTVKIPNALKRSTRAEAGIPISPHNQKGIPVRYIEHLERLIDLCTTPEGDLNHIQFERILLGLYKIPGITGKSTEQLLNALANYRQARILSLMEPDQSFEWVQGITSLLRDFRENLAKTPAPNLSKIIVAAGSNMSGLSEVFSEEVYEDTINRLDVPCIKNLQAMPKNQGQSIRELLTNLYVKDSKNWLLTVHAIAQELERSTRERYSRIDYGAIPSILTYVIQTGNQTSEK